MANGGAGDLFRNPLFLQYLSGAGQALSQGESVAPALNKITQQNIAATSKAKLQQKYMEMMRDMLAGGGKMTIDKDNFNIKAPSSVFSGDSEMTLGLPEDSLLGELSPSSSPPDVSADQVGRTDVGAALADIGPADVAGLTPQDVSQALSGAISTERLRSNVAYQRALTEQARATKPLDQPFPVEVPGVGQVTQRQWSALPASDKEYALFVETSKRLGDEDIMSKQEYEALEPTEKEKFLRAAMDDPKLMSAAKELAKSGATRISLGERVEQAEALADVKARKYINDPKGLVADIDKHLSSKAVRSDIRRAGPERKGLETARKSIEFVENKIRSAQGTVTDVNWEGDIITWTFTYPNGETGEFSYAVGPRPTQ